MMHTTQSTVTRYAAMFERLRARGEGAFVPFVTLGDPGLEVSGRLLRELVAGGADALELGIPFSDPTADGPVIQAATVRALEAGVTPQTCWRLLEALRRDAPDIPIGLLVYANLVVNRGADDFYACAAQAGVDSVLVADVPCLEAAPFVEAAVRHGVDPVLIAPPNADEARLRQIAGLCRGYTYVVTRSGVTGARDEVVLENAQLVRRLSELGAPPAVLGFGISRPEHVRAALKSGAAGAISGSAVVRHVARHLDDEAAMRAAVRGFVREMKAATA